MTKKEAVESMQEMKNKEKLSIQRKNVSVIDVMRENLELKKDTNEIGKGKYERVNRTINVIEKSEMFNIALDEVTKEDIDKYYVIVNNLSQSSINKINEQFHQSFRYAIIKVYIKENPMTNISKPIITREFKER